MAHATSESDAQPTKGERTRAAIVDAAAALFSRRAFDAVTVREIGAAAGVNPGLIHHYFGSKEGLFTAVVQRSVQATGAGERLAGVPAEELGAQLVRMAEAAWGAPEQAGWMSMMRRAVAESPERLRDIGEKVSTAALVAVLPEGLDHRELRAQLAASQLAGLVLLRHVAGVGVFAQLDTEEVVALVGPTVQRYLTGELAV